MSVKLLEEYERLFAESYTLAGHHTGFGVKSPASHRERLEHSLKVKAARAALVDILEPRTAQLRPEYLASMGNLEERS